MSAEGQAAAPIPAAADGAPGGMAARGRGPGDRPVKIVTPPTKPPENPPPRWGRSRWLAAGGGLLLLAAACVAWWAMHRMPAVHYTTAPVSRGTVTRMVTATGTVNPVLTVIVGSYVSGVIQELSCDYNTLVKKGQICAKLDPRQYQSVMDQVQANLDVALAQLEKDNSVVRYTQINDARNRKLVSQDSVALDTADIARSAFEQARAQVALDRASIELRKAELVDRI